MKKRTIKALVFSMLNIFVLSSLVTFGQGKTNFSGTWNFNESKSQAAEGPRMVISKINVTQGDSSITFERTMQGQNGEEFTSKDLITLDGKECQNTFFGNNIKKSKASWSDDGKILTITSNASFERDGETMEFNTIEKYNLSDDGKTLTLDSTVSSSFGEMKSTSVYDKV